MEQKWYAVYTKPGNEKKVCSVLSKKNIEHYYPVNKVGGHNNSLRNTTCEPLFPCFVFVKTTEQQHIFLQQITGVINMVYWKNAPAVFPDEEINCLADFISNHQNISTKQIAVNQTNSIKPKRVIYPVHTEQTEQPVKLIVEVTLPSIGYSLSAELRNSEVETTGVSNVFPFETFSNKYAV
ncbi:transcription termination/antitermination NusG family protein [Danxiaibacter flavus]|uniref:Transcription termination/antitermination NusG family protein n=1 Tax=Danxiaibacter flavus TaxID=3049108 RepID=A0ABV3ZJ67_9BACT|nr:transcription termination/antitermination NusG family protein [Chitinophagaceae bacterium DXS]